MQLFALMQREKHYIYRALDLANRDRQLSYLKSMVRVHIEQNNPLLTLALIKALHFHAAAGLLPGPGQIRTSSTQTRAVEFAHFSQVPSLMEAMLNQLDRMWHSKSALQLAAYVFWRICYIHPFSNGNGRTARAASYFVLCVKTGRWIEGEPILPMRMYYLTDEYQLAVEAVNETVRGDTVDTSAIELLMQRDLARQNSSDTYT